jgi:hypothetical protein
METQVSEFGQTPKQLFVVPHPKRVPRAEWTGDVPIEATVSSAAAASGGSVAVDATGSVSLSSAISMSMQRKASG